MSSVLGRILQPSDSLLGSFEGKLLKENGKKRVRTLNLIENTSCKEVIILTSRPKRFGFTHEVKEVIVLDGGEKVRGSDNGTGLHLFPSSSPSTPLIFSFPTPTLTSATLVAIDSAITRLKTMRSSGARAFTLEWAAPYLSLAASEDRYMCTTSLGSGSGADQGGEVADETVFLPTATGGTYDPAEMAQFKDMWVERKLKHRMREYTSVDKLSLFVGSWNVNGKTPSEDLDKWFENVMFLRPGVSSGTAGRAPEEGEPVAPPAPLDGIFKEATYPSGSATAPAGRSSHDLLAEGSRVAPEPAPVPQDNVPSKIPDIAVLGFQELDLSAETFLLNNSSMAPAWESAICSSLQKVHKTKYKVVTRKQLVGMLIVVLCKEDILSDISDVHLTSVGVGIAGIMGNKGGVGVSLKVQETTFCFINTHLTPHLADVHLRNGNYSELCRRMAFGPQEKGIFEHDRVFWFGDLNYRVTEPYEGTIAAIEAGKWVGLLPKDQLRNEQAAGRTFLGWSEAPIDFCPTYKYGPGTHSFKASEKKRIPSWCDRVLWKGEQITSHHYGRAELLTSDHKPVRNLFQVGVSHIIQDKYQTVYQDICRELDRVENDLIPDASLSTTTVNFQDVEFLTPYCQSVILKNIGNVITVFNFISTPGGNRRWKPWMDVHPRKGTLDPGEEVELKISVVVDPAHAAALNTGTVTLDDILIIRLTHGKDLFVSVDGNYLRSSFGTGIPELVRYHTAIRGNPKKCAIDDSLKIPKELWRMVDFLHKSGGVGKMGLFVESGDPEQCGHVRKCVDVGSPFVDADKGFPVLNVHSVAETVVRWLDALPEPVIPFAYYQRCVDNCNNYTALNHVINSLPVPHRNVFVYLMAFLREILKHSNTNSLSAEELAIVFSNVLLRSKTPPPPAHASLVSKRRAAFVLNFISDHNIGGSAGTTVRRSYAIN